jgi:hypothetical protein
LEEYLMTSFVHVEQPTQHPGVARAEAVIEHLRASRTRFTGALGLAALLLAAMVSALLVVADKLISNWSDGGLLVAWVVLWAVAFFALALFADSARSLAGRIIGAWQAGAERRATARADAQFLAHAQSDPRLMDELQAAITRQEALPARTRSRVPVATVTLRKVDADVPDLPEATRRVNIAYYF